MPGYLLMAGVEWFGKFLGVRKLPECDPEAEASLALVANAQSTVLGERWGPERLLIDGC